MIEAPEEPGKGAEEYGGDQDAEAPTSPEQVEADSERDQAEGE